MFMNPWFKPLRDERRSEAAVERMHAQGIHTLPFDGGMNAFIAPDSLDPWVRERDRRTHALHPWFRYPVPMPRSRVISPDAVRFGATVKRLRVARGWTRKKLSQRAGLTPQYVAIVEQGGNVPSLTTVLELIEVLGGDIAEVMRELMVARNSPV
jgi:DNA-binding XRE family transcriptional regulator